MDRSVTMSKMPAMLGQMARVSFDTADSATIVVSPMYTVPQPKVYGMARVMELLERTVRLRQPD